MAAADGHGKYSPALWGDRGTPLHPPAPSPCDLLATADATVEIETGIARLPRTVRVELLEEEGTEALHALALRDTGPLPVSQDREGYYSDAQHITYWLSGLGDTLLLRALAADHRSLESGGRLLDFGCSSGRVLRHIPAVMPGVEPWGVDLGLHNVRWVREHLPHLIVAQNTTLPSLPFEERFFDWIFAGSVFTHIGDFEEAWLLELRRILKPGGWALLTFHPERLWQAMGNPEHFIRKRIVERHHRLDPPGVDPVTADVFARPIPGDRVVFTDMTWPVNNTQLIHSHEWVRARWGRIMPLQRIIDRAHGEYQDGALLVRP